MPIHLRQNQYRGINAHLHSFMQQEDGGWGVFHAAHIMHLAEAIVVLLPSGYAVEPEKGMQIHRYHPDTGEPILPKWKPKPAVTIYDRGASPHQAAGSTLAVPTLTLSAEESIELDRESYMTAIVIRELTEQGKIGKPVTWIELLSPTNKPPNSGYWHYRDKRIAAIQNGIALVEIDYLHETQSPVPRLPSYPYDDDRTFPYTIVVTNPRPSLREGKLEIYGFRVDEPIPTIAIPLLGEEMIALDINTVYNRTFTTFPTFSLRADYEQLPVNFERYHPSDQQRIQARMASIRAEVSQKS